MMPAPNIVLAIDTSTDACVVALKHKGEVAEDFRVIPRQHNLQLLQMVNELLDRAGVSPADLELLVFGRGPGSFTGIRIATGVVQGMGFGLDIPVAGVSTLASLAQGRHRTRGDQQVAVAVQARQEEIYWGCFDARAGIATLVGEERLIHCSEARLPESGRWVGVGSGWHHRTMIEQALGREADEVEVSVHPRGQDLLALGLREHELGRTVAAVDATPVYLRELVAVKSGAQRDESDGRGS